MQKYAASRQWAVAADTHSHPQSHALVAAGTLRVMRLTPIHRALGEPASSELSSELLDRAVMEAVPEGQELEWKSQLPEGQLSASDFPKDLAALANSGGGLIVYGVLESNQVATGRTDVELTEQLERKIRAVAASAVMPPLLALEISQVGVNEPRAVAVRVPASDDAPHLITKGDRFAAAVRNGADTRWMTERELEQAYRRRFEARRQARADLEEQFAHASEDVASEGAAWFVGVTRPTRRDQRPVRLEPRAAMQVLDDAHRRWRDRVERHVATPDLLTHAETAPRAGLRSVVFHGGNQNGAGVMVQLFDDGAVSFGAKLGDLRINQEGDRTFPWEVAPSYLESAVASLAALVDVRSAAGHDQGDAMDVMAGIAWRGDAQLSILQATGFGEHFGSREDGLQLRKFRPVTGTWFVSDAHVDDDGVHTLAEDLINHAGRRGLKHLRNAT